VPVRFRRVVERVPGILVDAVVEASPGEHMQNYGTHYDTAAQSHAAAGSFPAYAG
jgi:acyl CoA:acetate/3-ketoacid CoA transferase